MTWRRIWFWWLLFVAVSWLGLELDSLWSASMAGQVPVQAWTLSDTIRGWSQLHRWLMPVVTGTAVFLLCHFFYERNPGGEGRVVHAPCQQAARLGRVAAFQRDYSMSFDIHAAIASIESRLPNIAKVLPLVHQAVTITEGLTPLMPAIVADVAAVEHNPAAAIKLLKDLAAAWTEVIGPALMANTPADVSADKLNQTEAAKGGAAAMIAAFLLPLGLALGGCNAVPTLSPADQAAAGAIATRIENGAAAVRAACAEALPLANFAGIVPVVGPYVATGVQVGCGTADGIAKLAMDPSSAEWVGTQVEIMKEALSKKGRAAFRETHTVA